MIDTSAADVTTPVGASAPADPSRTVEREKVRQLAREFEAMLITQMLRGMRQSMLSDNEEGLGNGTMTDTIDSQLGLSLSRAGGIGLADVLIRAFDRQLGPAVPTADPSVTPTVPDGSPTPTAVPEMPSAPITDATPTVTSGFGWRNDPISGATKFHAGTDLRAAYGQPVHAAAGGRVAFAGDQGGYGLTVVIDHGNGCATRYAHLSGYSVQAGDEVGSGQVVARTGNSGRSTGPHLHLELLKDGKAVDPTLIVKGITTVADSQTYQSVREEITK